MRLHERFEWDEEKADENLRKHGISFDMAAEALHDAHGDTFHVEIFDTRHSREEERWITMASHPMDRTIVLYIAWTERETGTRIISARKVNTHERTGYEHQIAQQQGRDSDSSGSEVV